MAVDDSLPIAVGVNGTRAGLVALDLAAAEAALRRTPLLIVHAWPGRYVWPPHGPTLPATESGARHLLAVAASHAQSLVGDLEVRTELAAGPAAEVLAHCSRRADMLVIGHRDNQLGRSDWGTTAIQLSQDCACPLLVHRGRLPRPGPVVVAVSGQVKHHATMEFAFRRADVWGARLIAMHVCDRSLVEVAEPPEAGPPDSRAAERRLADVLATTRWAFRRVPVEQVVVPVAEMAYVIDRASRRARLLVAGAGHGGRVAAVMSDRVHPGSTRRGLCPVALIPPASCSGERIR